MANDFDVQDLLIRYRAWSDRRAVLSATEGDGRQRVDPDDWADSDDEAVELARALATVLAQVRPDSVPVLGGSSGR